MDQVAIIISLVIGAVVGGLGARVLQRTGFGVVGDIIVGMIGGIGGAWIWTFIHAADGFDPYHTVTSSAVGGLVLLVLWRLARR